MHAYIRKHINIHTGAGDSSGGIPTYIACQWRDSARDEDAKSIYILRGGHVFAPEDLGQRDVIFSSGKIIAILAPNSDEAKLLSASSLALMINATGALVVPGLVDLHVHVSISLVFADAQVVCMCVCMYVRMYACMHACMCVSMLIVPDFVAVYVDVGAFFACHMRRHKSFVQLCMYAFTYIHICIHMYAFKSIDVLTRTY
jgi:hypothetical protein